MSATDDMKYRATFETYRVECMHETGEWVRGGALLTSFTEATKLFDYYRQFYQHVRIIKIITNESVHCCNIPQVNGSPVGEPNT